MDDTNRKLMLLIAENPRMQYCELQRRLGISRQAVHDRIQMLARTGAFKTMKATVSANYLGAVPAAVWGRSEANSMDDVVNKLRKSEIIGRIIMAGDNYLYVLGCLRRAADLDGYVDFVRRNAEMPEPTVGLAKLNAGIMPEWAEGVICREGCKPLSALDLKIIASLQDDVRKRNADIARSLGVSAKTVRRHIEDMVAGGSLDYDVPWDLPPGADILTVIHVTLRNDADKTRVARRLLNIDPVHLNYFRSFANLPRFLLGMISCDRMTDIRKLLKAVREDEAVLNVTPNLVFAEHTCMNWMMDCGDISTTRRTGGNRSARVRSES